ncbi:MAG: hypothetical protein DMG76_37185 [Acidobacteria bacterium]|nr:MAG: hypothetical protein DMG76_37185 [Acidobacteriota bacterium]
MPWVKCWFRRLAEFEQTDRGARTRGFNQHVFIPAKLNSTTRLPILDKNDSPHFHYDLAPPNLLLQDCPVEIMQITSSFRLILAFGNMDE